MSFVISFLSDTLDASQKEKIKQKACAHCKTISAKISYSGSRVRKAAQEKLKPHHNPNDDDDDSKEKAVTKKTRNLKT